MNCCTRFDLSRWLDEIIYLCNESLFSPPFILSIVPFFCDVKLIEPNRKNSPKNRRRKRRNWVEWDNNTIDTIFLVNELNVGEKKKTRERILNFFFLLCWSTSIRSRLFQIAEYRVLCTTYEEADAEEGKRSEEKKKVENFISKILSIRHGSESINLTDSIFRREIEILAGIKKKKNTNRENIRNRKTLVHARLDFSHHFHSRDSDYVSCQCTRAYAIFQLSYFNWMRSLVGSGSSTAAWTEWDMRREKTFFIFPFRFRLRELWIIKTSFRQRAMQFTRLKPRWYYAVRKRGSENSFTFFSAQRWSVLQQLCTHFQLSSTRVSSHPWEREIWRMCEVDIVCMHRYRARGTLSGVLN